MNMYLFGIILVFKFTLETLLIGFHSHFFSSNLLNLTHINIQYVLYNTMLLNLF